MDKPIYTTITDPEHWGKIISEHAIKGAALPGDDCGKMCNTCAFKFNQVHDESYNHAVDGAVNMLGCDGKFHCHTDGFEDNGQPCAGFQYAQKWLKHWLAQDEE